MQVILKYEHLRYATDVAHFSSQLMKPMMKPKIWDDFVSTASDDSKYPKPLNVKLCLKVGSVSGTSGTEVIDNNSHEPVIDDEQVVEDSSSVDSDGDAKSTSSSEEDDTM